MMAGVILLLAATWPASRSGHCAVAIGHKAYLFGGIDTHSREHAFVRTVECYDIESKSVSKITSMPMARAMAAATVLNGNIYVAGGIDEGNQDTKTLVSYDPFKNTWRTCAPMRAPRSRFTLTVHMGKLYAIGAVPESSVEIYDPKADKWSPGPRLPYVLHAHAAVEYQGRLTVLGGNNPDETTNMLWLDDHTNTWRKGPSLNVARTFFAAVVYRGDLFAIGCHRGSPHPEVLRAGSNRWAFLPVDDCKAERFAGVSFRDMFIAFGSEVGSDPSGWTMILR